MHIADGVQIATNVSIGAGCVIGERSQIGAGTRLWANVTIYHGIQIGENGIIHSGVVIGADGFGLAKDQAVWHKVCQLGSVIIGNDVEIGANTTIDRGALEDTVIEDGVKLDNLVQIAHNVRIGAHTAIAGCTGIAGSTEIGSDCLIGGDVAINGHIKLTNNVMIGGSSTVRNTIKEPGMYSCSTSVQKDHVWRKNFVRVRQLDSMARRLRALEKVVEKNQQELVNQDEE